MGAASSPRPREPYAEPCGRRQWPATRRPSTMSWRTHTAGEKAAAPPACRAMPHQWRSTSWIIAPASRKPWRVGCPACETRSVEQVLFAQRLPCAQCRQRLAQHRNRGIAPAFARHEIRAATGEEQQAGRPVASACGKVIGMACRWPSPASTQICCWPDARRRSSSARTLGGSTTWYTSRPAARARRVPRRA